GYNVVNGCQSLRGLYESRDKITPELRILTKLINVSPEGELASQITDHTNNQNGISARDLKSNHPIQTRLQSEIRRSYAGEIYYRTKKGEQIESPTEKVLENELAGRILLAFDLKRPEACHLVGKVFDDFHGDIFGRPQVNADRIIATYDIYQCVMSKLDLMRDKLFGWYSLTRYVLLYLIRSALETEALGKAFCDNPSDFLNQPKGRARLNQSI